MIRVLLFLACLSIIPHQNLWALPTRRPLPPRITRTFNVTNDVWVVLRDEYAAAKFYFVPKQYNIIKQELTNTAVDIKSCDIVEKYKTTVQSIASTEMKLNQIIEVRAETAKKAAENDKLTGVELKAINEKIQFLEGEIDKLRTRLSEAFNTITKIKDEIQKAVTTLLVSLELPSLELNSSEFRDANGFLATDQLELAPILGLTFSPIGREDQLTSIDNQYRLSQDTGRFEPMWSEKQVLFSKALIRIPTLPADLKAIAIPETINFSRPLTLTDYCGLVARGINVEKELDQQLLERLSVQFIVPGWIDTGALGVLGAALTSNSWRLDDEKFEFLKKHLLADNDEKTQIIDDLGDPMRFSHSGHYDGFDFNLQIRFKKAKHQ